MQNQTTNEIKQAVRDTYGNVAKAGTGAAVGCGCDCACGPGTPDNVSAGLGYSKDDVTAVPTGANMGLGCGNPQAIAALKPGETVLDLGSGGGFDCFLAAKAVGEDGRVIGVDMTAEMINKANENAKEGEFNNVEFHLGEIESLPVPDQSVDVIMSNCVINLSPEKRNVFQEAFRILKQGGRLAITDIVATAPLPEEVQKDLALYAGCIAGAALIEDLESMLAGAGFSNIEITPIDKSKEIIREFIPGRKIEDFVISATIEAVKP